MSQDRSCTWLHLESEGLGAQKWPIFDGIKVNTFSSITKGGKFPRNCQFALINLLFDFRYFPYNPDPAQLKKKTDRALELLKQITSINIDENKMKPREVKALVQVLGVFYKLAERLKDCLSIFYVKLLTPYLPDTKFHEFLICLI